MREVEDGLPPALLLLDGMRRLTVEGDADGDAFRAGRELDLGVAIAEGVFDPFVLDVPVMLAPQPFVTTTVTVRDAASCRRSTSDTTM